MFTFIRNRFWLVRHRLWLSQLYLYCTIYTKRTYIHRPHKRWLQKQHFIIKNNSFFRAWLSTLFRFAFYVPLSFRSFSILFFVCFVIRLVIVLRSDKQTTLLTLNACYNFFSFFFFFFSCLVEFFTLSLNGRSFFATNSVHIIKYKIFIRFYVFILLTFLFLYIFCFVENGFADTDKRFSYFQHWKLKESRTSHRLALTAFCAFLLNRSVWKSFLAF